MLQIFSLNKTERLKGDNNFASILNYNNPNKKVLYLKNFVCLVVANNLNHPRLGIRISKKINKSAVLRNQIKRLVRENYRQHKHNLSNSDYIFLGKKNLKDFDKKNKSFQAAIKLELGNLW